MFKVFLLVRNYL